jgi:hypothetical protein
MALQRFIEADRRGRLIRWRYASIAPSSRAILNLMERLRLE